MLDEEKFVKEGLEEAGMNENDEQQVEQPKPENQRAELGSEMGQESSNEGKQDQNHQGQDKSDSEASDGFFEGLDADVLVDVSELSSELKQVGKSLNMDKVRDGLQIDEGDLLTAKDVQAVFGEPGRLEKDNPLSELDPDDYVTADIARKYLQYKGLGQKPEKEASPRIQEQNRVFDELMADESAQQGSEQAESSAPASELDEHARAARSRVQRDEANFDEEFGE